jgi:hypothetical protein
MKFPTILLTSLLFLSGCSHQNAFTKFELSGDQEAAMASLQSSKIQYSDKVAGVVSVIYLNEVYPKSYNGKEYFLLYFYLKEDQKEIFDPTILEHRDLQVQLNNTQAIKIKQLPTNNRFAHLSGTQSKWSRYYLVAFQEQSKNQLSLVLKDGKYSSNNITFRKNEE